MDDYLISADKEKIDLQSEYNVIGCLLVKPVDSVNILRGIITPDDFLSDTCRALYTAAADLVNSGQTIDQILIQNRASEMGYDIDADLCREIQACYTTNANITAHAERIREASQRRKAVAVGMELAEEKLSVLDAVGKLQEIICRHKQTAGTPEEMANELTDYLFTNDAAPPFLSTGYNSLDKILNGGFSGGGIYIFAARTNVGKTNVGINIAEKIAKRGKKVLYFSFEMSRIDINARRTAIISGVSSSKILDKSFRTDKMKQPGKEEREKEQKVVEALKQIYRQPFLIYDLPCTLNEIEREIRSHDDLSLIVIDHIGIISDSDGAGRTSQYQAMTAISHRLKRIALSTRIPFLVLAQLNREVEKRNDKEPMLSDLRDSGSLEEDADAVILLYRESLYLEEKDRPKPWEADNMAFLIKKNRRGALGTAIMKFYGDTLRIVEEERFR